MPVTFVDEEQPLVKPTEKQLQNAAENRLSLVPESLKLVSDSLDDVERLRKATKNRYQAATSTWIDPKTGVVRGLGLDETDKFVAGIGMLIAALEHEEHQIELQLKREIRKTVFGPWLKLPENKGLGEKTLARLLASIGDPFLRSVVTVDPDTGKPNGVTEVPRTLGQLYAYAGYGVENGAAKRVPAGATQEEVFANGKAEAKMRAYLIAEGFVKAGVRTIDKSLNETSIEISEEEAAGLTKTQLKKLKAQLVAGLKYPLDNREAITPYGQLYLDRRRETIDRVHAVECKRCGPSGKPAEVGTPWSGAHQQADALRMLAKRILKDLYEISRTYHLENNPERFADYIAAQEQSGQESLLLEAA